MKNIFLTVSSLLFAGCTIGLVPEENNLEEADMEQPFGKICNSMDNAVGDRLIAKFTEDAVPYLEEAAEKSAMTKSPATRAGIEAVDDVLSTLGIVSLERVFPVSPKHEARTRESGLHRWYVLKFAPGQDMEDAAEKLAPLTEISTIQFSTERTKSFSGEAIPFVTGIQPQTRSLIKPEFNDPDIYWQWHYINNADQAIATASRSGADINVAEAWKLTGGHPEVIVAVVDEGVKYTHPDLAGNMWVNPEPSAEYDYKDIHGWNFAADTPITWDKVVTDDFGKTDGDSGHGTHVAGTVAAVNNNGVGVAGVAGGTGKGDGVKIMSCQVFSGGLAVTDEIVSRAIKYAADHGASILQCSYGYSGKPIRSDREYAKTSPLELDALKYFMSADNCAAIDGGLAIFAAGNSANSISDYPGGYRDCISVTSVSVDGLPAYYTCYGPGCNIAAPGGETIGFSGKEKAGVLSTICSELSGTDYGYMQGTSMACPHVSGVAALGLSYALAKGKHYTREEFISMLLTSVVEIDSRFDGFKTTGAKINLEDYKGKMGTGLVDAYQLLLQIEGTPCLKVSAGKLELCPLDSYFGGSSEKLTYLDVEVSEEDMEKLGMEARPEIYHGKLMVKCAKSGTARVTVKAVAGGIRPGSETIMGGIEITKTFALIVKDSWSGNGGWL